MGDGGGLAALGAERYVRLTTFRRTGEGVGTAVWVAPDVDDPGTLWVTTTAGTGKVARLRHTPRVVLAPCDRRGRVAAGATEVEAVGEVVEDAASRQRCERALRAEHHAAFVAFGVVSALGSGWQRLRGRPPAAHVGVRIRPAGAA